MIGLYAGIAVDPRCTLYYTRRRSLRCFETWDFWRYFYEALVCRFARITGRSQSLPEEIQRLHPTPFAHGPPLPQNVDCLEFLQVRFQYTYAHRRSPDPLAKSFSFGRSTELCFFCVYLRHPDLLRRGENGGVDRGDAKFASTRRAFA